MSFIDTPEPPRIAVESAPLPCLSDAPGPGRIRERRPLSAGRRRGGDLERGCLATYLAPMLTGPRRFRGFTLTELLLLSLVVGLAAVILGYWVVEARERRWTGELRAGMDTVLAAMDDFHAQRGRWPGTLRELSRGAAMPDSARLRVCVFNIVPTGPDAPYVVVAAAHPRAQTRVFTLHPLWAGRIEAYRTSGTGCGGRVPYEPASPFPPEAGSGEAAAPEAAAPEENTLRGTTPEVTP